MKGKLAKGAAWVAASRALINLISFSNTLLLARLLTPADFGIVAIASTVSFVVSALTELSLSQSLIQHRNPEEEHFHSAWTLNLARSTVLAALIVALAWPIAWFYSDPRLGPIMLVIGAGALLTGLTNPKLVTFQRNLVFWQDFVLNVSQRAVGLAFAAAVAIVFRNYWAIVAGIIATQVSAVMLSFLFVRYRPKLQLRRARELLSFSVWLSLGQAVNTLNWRTDHLAIGYVLGGTALGHYTVGDSLAVLPTREATAPLAQTLFPGFSRINDDIQRLRGAYQRAQTLLCAVALPVGFTFALIAKPLVLLTMGEKWLPAVLIIQFLSGIFAVQTLSSSLQPLAMALGATRSLFKRDLVNLGIRIPLIIVGMIFYGVPGVVVARCISGTANTLVNMAMVRHLLNLPIRTQLAANARALASTVAMVLLVSALDRWTGEGTAALFLVSKIAILSCAAVLTYLASTICLWVVAGRPTGPESEIASLFMGVLRRRSA
ncbi:lipopolysaccharide biosynthesis protein [Inquilinus limosus]|uniref:lipopolysaccharide biosynthesis protein n=1 Tax=Inquilinus limosus TaxID=171674 RepID=UPI0013774889|nr:lipopolysaccharide biosynthesis protein [Inquilinus limosus]